MAKALNFDTGVIEYDINGAATVRFNPTDAKFVERFYNTFKTLENEQDELQSQIEAAGDDGEKILVVATARDNAMRGYIDGLFAQDGIADAIFPNINCYALAGGMPMWVNFLFAVAEEIESAFAEQGKLHDPRMKQLSDKNAELLAKYKKATTKK
jgi:hypothetical protein